MGVGVGGKLRVGVVGAGIGRAHIEALYSLPDQYEVLALCDTDGERARALAEEKGIPRFSTRPSDLCRMDDLDVIDVCTPSYLHVAQSLEALAAGKHVVCEKPVAGSLREIDDLIEAEGQAGRRLMPIFQNRFGHGVEKLKLLVDEGVTGALYLATIETAWRRRASYYASWHGKWATELGGALVTLAIHAHDVLYYVCGPAKRVFARTATYVNPIETEDTVSASLEMKAGGLASLSVTTGSSAQLSRWRFCFSQLSAESHAGSDALAPDPWRFTADSDEAEARVAAALSQYEPLPVGFGGQFYRLHAALRDGSELPVTLADARASLELITALYHSARTGADVAMPITADHPLYDGWQPEVPQ
jgi:predicted dehydrogenase